MSYSLKLVDTETGEAALLMEPHNMKGCTHQIGGCPSARLSITYNYSKHYYRVFGDKGIRTIYGMTGLQSIPVIKAAADQLGDDIDDNYWRSTEGNAKRALIQLLRLAAECPDAVWDGD